MRNLSLSDVFLQALNSL